MPEGMASVRAQVTEAEWQVRVDLAACYRLCALHGWNDTIFTHISARVPGTDGHFLLNPFGLFFDEITASSLVKLDGDGNILIDSTGLGYNDGGYVIHSAIHAARADAHSVIHLHTDAGVAVSAQKDGVLPLNQDALSILPDLAYHDYEGIAIDLDERARLVADIGDKNAVILRNHGLLTIGTSIPAAFAKMHMLQKVCTIQVMALSGGAALNFPSLAAQDTVADQVANHRARAGAASVPALAWEGYRRRLDRVDAGYRS